MLSGASAIDATARDECAAKNGELWSDPRCVPESR